MNKDREKLRNLVLGSIIGIGGLRACNSPLTPPESATATPINTVDVGAAIKAGVQETVDSWTQTPIATEAITNTVEIADVITNTPEPTKTATAENTATAEVKTSGNWIVETHKGATDQMKTWVTQLKDLNPEVWTVFPNVDNPKADFKAKDGLEYGMAESVFCQQDNRCNIPVPAEHYRLITGDYNIPGIDACSGSVAKEGCGIMIINVGKVTSNFVNAKVVEGFTVFGRYWNGDAMPTAIWAGLSETANNMLNKNSKLNPDGSVNAGANCSVPEGCNKVRLVFAVVSGNELLVKGETIISR